MKIVLSSIFRALCAIVIGALLVQYRDKMVEWLTISIGALFFISGVISCIAFYVQKRRYMETEKDGVVITDAEGKPIHKSAPVFPIVGIGSVVLGIILAFKPDVFTEWHTYIFASLIVLGTLTQFISLIAATKYGKVSWIYWVMPIILFGFSIVTIINPSFLGEETKPYFYIGWAMMIYGIVEVVNALKVHRLRKIAEKALEIPTAEEVVEESQEVNKEAN